MTIDIEQLRKDMEAGTQGDWVVNETGDTYYIEFEPGFNHAEACNEEDARRIARVPQLERDYLALREAAEELAEEVKYLRGASPLGDYDPPQMSISKAVLVDALKALAAYRAAIK